MRKDTFLIVDTETTIRDTVADLGIIIVDKKGNILNSAAILVREFYLDKENSPLFHDTSADPLWGKANLPKRYAEYDAMLEDGRRMLASVPAVNRWLAKANAQYKPIVTAYNWAFDRSKLRNSGIDFDQFERSFCLWHHAADTWGRSKKYLQFVLDCHGFNKPTKLGNMSYKSNAEIMARFILNNPSLEDEPHTAFEDALDYELPILLALLKKKSTKKLLETVPGYNWRDYQVKDYYKPA